MYGIFNHIWVVLGQMLVNIPYMEHMGNIVAITRDVVCSLFWATVKRIDWGPCRLPEMVIQFVGRGSNLLMAGETCGDISRHVALKILYFEWSPPWHDVLTFYMAFYLTYVLVFWHPFWHSTMAQSFCRNLSGMTSPCGVTRSVLNTSGTRHLAPKGKTDRRSRRRPSPGGESPMILAPTSQHPVAKPSAGWFRRDQWGSINGGLVDFSTWLQRSARKIHVHVEDQNPSQNIWSVLSGGLADV